MRRLPHPSSASIPYQLREILFSYTPGGGLPLPAPHATSWPLTRRHDPIATPSTTSDSSSRRHLTTTRRRDFLSAAAAGLATAGDSSNNNITTISNNRPYGQNHDREDDTTAPPRQDEDRSIPALPRLPYKFETGISLFAKRAPRPFPPPFLSPPSGSFSDPLSTHHRSRNRRPKVNGELIKGWTNGDDAAFASEYFIGANDGVGAWSARPRGHAGLWARLILHFWATAMSEDAGRPRGPDRPYQPDPVAYLQRAYELTKEATSGPDWQGTTTATGAQLFYKELDDKESAHDNGARTGRDGVAPVLYVTNLGDSQVMVVRPSSGELVFKTQEQWHWFDCPRQLGTNSPDTPAQNAVLDTVPIKEGDVVLAMSDGVIDNLWSHEIVENVSNSVKKWEAGEARAVARRSDSAGGSGAMAYVAEELMLAAKTIALDPFAESPFMEHAIEEGLPSEGGKLDDISVVAARCMRNND